MYAVVNKSTKQSAIFKEKLYLSEYIGCSTDTIRRNDRKLSWEWDNFEVFNPQIIKIKSKRGGKNNFCKV